MMTTEMVRLGDAKNFKDQGLPPDKEQDMDTRENCIYCNSIAPFL